jgi:O-antigen/teichoic acid export membrane protein
MIAKIRNNIIYLQQGQFLRNITTLASATILAQGVSVLSALFLTRLYSPKDFGLLAIFSSVFCQLLVFASLRYEWAITLPNDEKDAAALVWLCIIINCLLTILTVLVIAIIREFLLWRNQSPLPDFWWLLPIIFLFGGLYQSLSYWALRQGNFQIISKTKIVQNTWGAFVQILLGYLKKGHFGLLIGVTLSYVVGTRQLLLLFLHDIQHNLYGFSAERITKVSREYAKFPTFSVVSSFCNSAGFIAPTILLAFFYTADDVGYFSLAQKITSIPSVAIGSSISQAYLSRVSILLRENPDQIKKLYRKTTFILILASTVISFAMFFSPYLFPTIFGEKWSQSGEMIKYMTLIFASSTAMSSISLLDWLEKQNWMLAWNAIRLLVICSIFLLSHHLNLSSTQAVGIFSVSGTIMYIILYPLNIKAINSIVLKEKY